MTDRLHLHRLSFFGRHGVLPEERVLGQRFVVSLTLSSDLSRAGRTDSLAESVDYARVAETARRIVEGPSVQLIETLAENIAAALGAEFPSLESATVRVLKPHPPVPFVFEGVEVEITREFARRG